MIIVNAYSINNHLPVVDELQIEEVDVTQMQKTHIGSTSISTGLLRTLTLTEIKLHLEIKLKINPMFEQQMSTLDKDGAEESANSDFNSDQEQEFKMMAGDLIGKMNRDLSNV